MDMWGSDHVIVTFKFNEEWAYSFFFFGGENILQ